MSKIKKIMLCIGAIFAVAVAGVIGFVCQKPQQNAYRGALNNTIIEEDNPLEFKPHEYEIVKGGNSINYKYSPNVDAKSTPRIGI